MLPANPHAVQAVCRQGTRPVVSHPLVPPLGCPDGLSQNSRTAWCRCNTNTNYVLSRGGTM